MSCELWHSGVRLPDDPGRYIPVAIRRQVMERDSYTCVYCATAPATDCDHVYPYKLGGTHHPTNLVAACERCNSIAGVLHFPEFVRKKAYILHRRLQIAAAERAAAEQGASA